MAEAMTETFCTVHTPEVRLRNRLQSTQLFLHFNSIMEFSLQPITPQLPAITNAGTLNPTHEPYTLRDSKTD